MVLCENKLDTPGVQEHVEHEVEFLWLKQETTLKMVENGGAKTVWGFNIQTDEQVTAHQLNNGGQKTLKLENWLQKVPGTTSETPLSISGAVGTANPDP